MNDKYCKLPNEFGVHVKSTINEIESLEGEISFIGQDGDECWYQNKMMPMFDEHHNKIGEILVRYDITQKKIYEKLSITDALTQLYNRRHFNHILSQEIIRATHNKSILCFIILDVDYFKKYNDSYGHKAGDEALVAVSKTLEKSLHRSGEFAFRLGGEEFGAIFTSQFNGSFSCRFCNNWCR